MWSNNCLFGPYRGNVRVKHYISSMIDVLLEMCEFERQLFATDE